MQSSHRARRLCVLSVFILLPFVALPQGVIIDQSANNPIHGYWVFGNQTLIGQEFVPSMSELSFVDLLLDGDWSGPAGTFDVRIHDSTLTGPVLGTSGQIAMPAGSGNPATERFYFPTIVPLIPGATYVMEVELLSAGAQWWWGVGYDGSHAYTKGSVVCVGYAGVVPSANLWFQEGVNVPEPSAAGLILIGIMTLGLCRGEKVLQRRALG